MADAPVEVMPKPRLPAIVSTPFEPLPSVASPDYREMWGVECGSEARPIGEVLQRTLAAAASEGSPSPVAYSLEVFPTRTPAAFAKLRSTLRSLRRTAPAFIDVTFAAGGGAGGAAAREATMAVCDFAQSVLGATTVMHVTCRGEKREDVLAAIDTAARAGVRNFMALRGDAQPLPEGGDLTHASELVKLIRAHPQGSSFGVAVAGYPEGHPECTSIDDDIDRLKEKVDAGADVVVSQLFLDARVFISWKSRCLEKGVRARIVPGIIFVNSRAGFERMLKLCGGRVTVPPHVKAELEALNPSDPQAAQAFGIRLAKDICQQLYDSGERVFHFYTLNMDHGVLEVLKGLRWLRPEPRDEAPLSPVRL